MFSRGQNFVKNDIFSPGGCSFNHSNNRFQSSRQKNQYKQGSKGNQTVSKCEFCFMQARGRGKSVDNNHDKSNCQEMIAKFSKVNMMSAHPHILFWDRANNEIQSTVGICCRQYSTSISIL